MRLSFLAVLAVLAFCIGLTAGNDGAGETRTRHLKGTQTSTDTEDEAADAKDEERAAWHQAMAHFKSTGELSKRAEAAVGGNKWQGALEKMKAAGKLDDGAAGAAGGVNKWQSSLEKIKASGQLNKAAATATKGQVVSPNKWQSAVAKIQAGGKLNALDETNNKWQGALAKMKATGQLKNVDDTKVAKIAEGAAQQIIESPKKSSAIKKALEITFGVALTALILVGFNAMVS